MYIKVSEYHVLRFLFNIESFVWYSQGHGGLQLPSDNAACSPLFFQDSNLGSVEISSRKSLTTIA